MADLVSDGDCSVHGAEGHTLRESQERPQPLCRDRGSVGAERPSSESSRKGPARRDSSALHPTTDTNVSRTAQDARGRPRRVGGRPNIPVQTNPLVSLPVGFVYSSVLPRGRPGPLVGLSTLTIVFRIVVVQVGKVHYPLVRSVDGCQTGAPRGTTTP